MSEFKEYEEWEASLDQKYLKQLSPDAFELSPAAFYAGQQSQQDKIDALEVQLKGAEERAKLILDHKNKMVDKLQKENDRLNTWYKNVKLQLENKQIDCDRSDREVDELQKKYDAMHNAFIFADDCRKEWHESYMNVRLERDELQARVDELKITQNNLELKAEDAECVSMSLDDQGVEKCDDDGKSYSLWGRVCQFKKSNNITERDELQARVDKVVHILTYTNHASTPLCNELRDILKGNKDEN